MHDIVQMKSVTYTMTLSHLHRLKTINPNPNHLHRLKTTPRGKGREKGNVGEQTTNVMRNALV